MISHIINTEVSHEKVTGPGPSALQELYIMSQLQISCYWKNVYSKIEKVTACRTPNSTQLGRLHYSHHRLPHDERCQHSKHHRLPEGERCPHHEHHQLPDDERCPHHEHHQLPDDERCPLNREQHEHSQATPGDCQEGWNRPEFSWLLVFLFLIISFFFTKATCQSCDFPSSNVFQIVETDPAGTEIVNINSSNGTHSWTYTTNLTWLPDFLSLTLDPVDLFYHMNLKKEFDLEMIYYDLNVTQISSFSFSLMCTDQFNVNQSRERFLIVQSVNEYNPEFNTSSIIISVLESVKLNSVVIILTNWASDRDVNPVTREISSFSFLPYTGDPQVNGHTWLTMLIPYDGLVVLSQELDYETLPENRKYIQLGVSVKDQGGNTGTAFLTVEVEDDDDLPPEFTYPGCGSPCSVAYTVTIRSNFTGPVNNIKPAAIQARDRDTLNFNIQYYIVEGNFNFNNFLHINPTTGGLTVLQELGAAHLQFINFIVEAREVSQLARSKQTTLFISVNSEQTPGTPSDSNSLGSDTVVIIVTTILGVVVLFVIILLIAFIIHYKKRDSKIVHPEDSTKSLNDEPVNMNGVHNETSLPSEVTDVHLLYSRGLNSSASSEGRNTLTAPPQTAHVSGELDNAELKTYSSRNMTSTQNSAQAMVDQDEAIEYIVPVFDATVVSQDQNVAVEKQLTTGQDRLRTAPKLKVVSGLMAQDQSEDNQVQILPTDGLDDTRNRSEKDSTENSSSSESGISNTDSSNERAPHTDTDSNNERVPHTDTDSNDERVPHTDTDSNDERALQINAASKDERAAYRKKPARRRVRTLVRDREDNIYDGTKEVEEIQLDPGFYTDSMKKRIKRSSQAPVVIPDPSDTRYWISVTDK